MRTMSNMDSQKYLLGTNGFSEDDFLSQKYLLGTSSPSSQDVLSQTSAPGLSQDLLSSQNFSFGTYGEIIPTGLEDEQNDIVIMNSIYKTDLMFSGMNYDLLQSQSQPFVEQNHTSLDKVEEIPDVSLLENNSFNLSQLEDQMSQFNQVKEADNVGLYTQTQLVSSSVDRGGVKLEANENHNEGSSCSHQENNYQFLNFRQENIRNPDTLNEDTVSASEVSSSQESQGDRLPAFEKFRGKYDFRVDLAEKSGVKKSAFRDDLNKIYCIPDYPILFNFYMDFAGAPFKKLSIQVVLYYFANSATMRNLEQCISCRQNERKVVCLEFDRNGQDAGGHIVRCISQTAEYGKKRRLFNSVEIPLEKPQPGAGRISRNYKFMCMNSCRVKCGKDYKQWTLVFYLMQSGKEVGRDSFSLKVCKCPSRDAMNDGKVGKNQRRSTEGVPGPESPQASSKKFGSEVKMKDLEQDLNISPLKMPRLSEVSTESGAQQGVYASTSRARPSGITVGSAGTSASGSRLAKKMVVIDSDDSESFSQEDSQGRKFNMLKFVESVKLALAHRKHPNPTYSQYTNVWVRQLSTMQRQMEYYTDHILKRDENVENCADDNEKI